MPVNCNLKSCFITIVAYTTFLFLISACAVKGRPEGGPPDTTPPEITYTFPAQDSTGIKELSVLKIHFSESMDESSVANNIFISPPILFKAEWQNAEELEIQLQDTLKINQTYVIVLGTNIQDLRRNKLSQSYQLAFSTGAKIDQGKISGKVHAGKMKDPLTIFAFEFTSDTMRFDMKKPDYISQTDNKGEYLLDYLSNGVYRVFAVRDQNQNQKIDADFENIGIPYTDASLDSATNEFVGLNFFLTKVDTLAPKLINIRAQNARQIDFRLSEKIILPGVEQISIADSITLQQAEVLAVSVNIESENTLEIYTAPLDSGKTYLGFIKSMQDSSGNVAVDTALSFQVNRTVKQDSFEIISFTPPDSSWNEHPGISIYFETNLPVNKKQLIQTLILKSQDGDTIVGNYSFPTAFETYFKPQEKLILDSVYTLSADLKHIKSVWGDSLPDSVVMRHFKISDGAGYGEIAGTVSHSGTDIPVSVSVRSLKDASELSVAQKQGEFRFDHLRDGDYQISSFLDIDSSGTYSPGGLFPFKYSEPFVVKQDTVKVRKRWETGGIRIELPKLNK